MKRFEIPDTFKTIDVAHGDSLKIMPMLASGTFDFVMTSPPYNVGVNYANKGRDADKKDLSQYVDFATTTMSHLYRLLCTGGRVCLELGGSAINFPLSYIWQHAAYCAGFGLYSEIVMEHRKTNPTAWGSWLKADNARTIPNFHILYVFYKETTSKKPEEAETQITSEEFVEWTRGYWRINWSQDTNIKHPAKYPVELPLRCLKLFGHKGDTVLDPFLGSGTTAIACYRLRRSCVGIELEKEYYELACNRIESEINQLRLF